MPALCLGPALPRSVSRGYTAGDSMGWGSHAQDPGSARALAEAMVWSVLVWGNEQRPRRAAARMRLPGGSSRGTR